MKRSNRNIFYTLFCIFFIFALSISSVFSYWNIAHDIISSETTPTKTNEPVCYNDKTGVAFTNVKKALDTANNGETIFLYIGADATCTESITINKGVSLVLPFVGQSFDSSINGDNVSDTPKYKIDKVEEKDSYGKRLGDDNETNVKKFRSCLLNMRNGADIIVNGTLSIGGVHSSNGNNGYYSEINLGLNSSITCNSGSTLDCFGYIKENYNDAVNSGMEAYKDILDNSCDSDRYLRINDGSIVNTYIALYDIREAGGFTGLIAAKQCPFNVFDFQAIQTYTTFEYGAIMNGSAIVVGPSDMSVMKDLPIVSKKGASNDSLLYMETGELSIEYLPVDARYSSRETSKNNSKIIINGSLEMGYIYLSEFGGKIELDTRLFHLPISSKLSLYVLNGSQFNCNQQVKFLMGSKLIIHEGGTFNINNSVAFYNSAIAPEKNASLGIYYDSTGKDDALLCCNGTLKINSDSSNKGYLGAKITHTSTTGNGTLDFKNISNVSYLSAEVTEGTANTKVIVSSSGKFYDGTSTFDAQFSSGNIYNSLYTDSLYYWSGNFVSTHAINVEYDTTILNPVFDYTITLSENADGSSPFASELTNMKSAGTTSVSNGIYMNLVVNNAASYTVIKNKTEIINCDSTAWIYVDSDFDINIVPSEGIEVSLECVHDTSYEDKSQGWSSGLGHTIFYILESTEENGSFTETFRQQVSKFTVYIKKGNYFKIGYNWDSEDVFIEASGKHGFTANNTITTNDPNFLPQPSTSWNNNTTSSCSDVFQAGNASTAPGLKYNFQLGYNSGNSASGGGCVTSDTLITLANGTKKLVSDINLGDMIKTWDFEIGEFTNKPVIYIEKTIPIKYERINVEFDDGSYLGIVYQHTLFDMNLRNYFVINHETAKDSIGKVVMAYDNGKLSTKTITNVTFKEEYDSVYEIVTGYDMNFVSNDIVSAEGMIITNTFFDVDEDYKYDPIAKERDIAQYGLYTYEEFSDYLTREQFELLNGAYFKIGVAKGYYSEDYLYYMINRFKTTGGMS